MNRMRVKNSAMWRNFTKLPYSHQAFAPIGIYS